MKVTWVVSHVRTLQMILWTGNRLWRSCLACRRAPWVPVPPTVWIAVPRIPHALRYFIGLKSEDGEVVKTCVDRTALDPVLLPHERCEWKFMSIVMHPQTSEEPRELPWLRQPGTALGTKGQTL